MAPADREEWRQDLVVMVVLLSCPYALAELLEDWSGALAQAAAFLRDRPP